jgi:hypothetical protein
MESFKNDINAHNMFDILVNLCHIDAYTQWLPAMLTDSDRESVEWSKL